MFFSDVSPVTGSRLLVVYYYKETSIQIWGCHWALSHRLLLFNHHHARVCSFEGWAVKHSRGTNKFELSPFLVFGYIYVKYCTLEVAFSFFSSTYTWAALSSVLIDGPLLRFVIGTISCWAKYQILCRDTSNQLFYMSRVHEAWLTLDNQERKHAASQVIFIGTDPFWASFSGFIIYEANGFKFT